MLMLPDQTKITITDNENKIKSLINELILTPRLKALEWSDITKQTPNMKIGYPGQHLASLITGVPGQRTGARGDDLSDFSEVKSCSRVDQMDKCKDCNSGVLRYETNCAKCGSRRIKRNNDSKWLFSMRSEEEVKLLVDYVPRVICVLADYPLFDAGNFDTIQFSAYEIWPKHPRCSRFSELITRYYENIYLSHIRINPNKTPAPKNFWPYSFQFYLCNSIKIFQATAQNVNSTPQIMIEHYVKPNIDRNQLESELMPAKLLSQLEVTTLLNEPRFIKKYNTRGIYSKSDFCQIVDSLDEFDRSLLNLRDTDDDAAPIGAQVRH